MPLHALECLPQLPDLANMLSHKAVSMHACTVQASDSSDACAAEPLVRVVRDTPNERILLEDGAGHLTTIDRVVKRKGYRCGQTLPQTGQVCPHAEQAGPRMLRRYPDIRHRFAWGGRSFLMDGHQHFSGKDFTCWDEASGEAVLHFKATFLPARQVGQVALSDKVSSPCCCCCLCSWPGLSSASQPSPSRRLHCRAAAAGSWGHSAVDAHPRCALPEACLLACSWRRTRSSSSLLPSWPSGSGTGAGCCSACPTPGSTSCAPFRQCCSLLAARPQC